MSKLSTRSLEGQEINQKNLNIYSTFFTRSLSVFQNILLKTGMLRTRNPLGQSSRCVVIVTKKKAPQMHPSIRGSALFVVVKKLRTSPSTLTPARLRISR